jgi:Carboxypeptidase regulatory-like domain
MLRHHLQNGDKMNPSRSQMLAANSVLLILLSSLGAAFGQVAIPVTESFHVRGTITDEITAVIPRAKVTFESKQISKTVTTNERGVYETDLPFGNYTMTAEVLGFRPYRRPLFRMTSPQNITFDFTLPVQPTCDLTVVRTDGGTATRKDLEAAEKEFCLREDFFSIPSSDGVPFQVWIRYVKHSRSGDSYLYTGQNTPNDDPVFVAYNLFSLRADKVIYDAKSNTITANGNVVTAYESGSIPRADAVAFKIENGRAIPIQ